MHIQAITAPQRRVLRALGPVATLRGFALAGGTAVALQLGHRRSLDLDWFTSLPFPSPLDLAADLDAACARFETGDISPGTLHGEASGVSVSFLEFRYPELAPSIPWPEGRCSLASLDDLAAMKLAALAQRGAKKDFVDVWALARDFRPLPELVAFYQKKFKVKDSGHLLFALAYLDDAEREPMPRMLWDAPWARIKKDLRSALKGMSSR